MLCPVSLGEFGMKGTRRSEIETNEVPGRVPALGFEIVDLIRVVIILLVFFLFCKNPIMLILPMGMDVLNFKERRYK